MRSHVKEWFWRYLPAELISLVTTLAPALIVQHQTQNAVAAAIAATWGGNLGYFGTILIRDIIRAKQLLSKTGKPYSVSELARTLRALLIEFGLAEILDSFFVRPTLMYYLPKWLGNFSAGIVLAKFLADVTFYLPAIIFYEWSKKRYRNY